MLLLGLNVVIILIEPMSNIQHIRAILCMSEGILKFNQLLMTFGPI